MGKKKFTEQNEIESISNFNFVKISEGVGCCLFFEIGGYVTTDICEGVALMMRNSVNDQTVWSKNIEKYLDVETIDARNCLYWLSGGDDEWKTRKFYKRPWNECDLIFQEEFQYSVLVVVKRSKTLGDIRLGFLKLLNLPIFYEFALSKNLI
jgi:hypothetical protein